MKINFSDIDRTQFKIKEGTIAGEPVFLVCPEKEGVTWSKDNLHFRSSMWDKDGNAVSLGFKKFFNLFEQPQFGSFEVNEPLSAVTKMDGSCLIVSSFKNNLIARTRETISVSVHDTGDETLDLIHKKYPKIVEHVKMLPEYSLIFEHTTPKNRIVLQYSEPDLTLLGVIDHASYGYFSQKMVDRIAKTIGVKRPEYHDFQNLEELLESAKARQFTEGWCIYYGEGQNEIRKVKTDWYLAAHRFKYGMSKDKLIDLFLSSGAQDEKAFKEKLAETYDFEILSGIDFSDLIKAYEGVVEIEKRVRAVVEPIRGLTRKEQAGEVYRQLPKDLIGYAFILLDNREFDDKIKKKIMSL